MNSRIRHYRVRRRDIAFVRHTVEACDGVAFVRTVDPAAGLIALHVPPGREAEADSVVRGLAAVMSIEPADAPGPTGGPHA